MSVTETMEALGGAAVLGKNVTTEPAFVRRVEEGLPSTALRRLQRFGRLKDADLAEFIPRRTLSELRKTKVLSREQSDRIARAARVVTLAQRVFNDADLAVRWLRTPNAALGGDSPLRLLRTGSGAALVEEVLQRIDHGVYE